MRDVRSLVAPDRKKNAAVLALMSRRMRARGEVLAASETLDRAIALDAEIAQAVANAPESLDTAMAAPLQTARAGLHAPRTPKEWLGAAAGVLFVAAILWYGVRPMALRALPASIPVPTAPAGGVVVRAPSYAIALPPSWGQIAMDETFDQSLAAFVARHPTFDIDAWARRQRTSNVRFAAVCVGPEVAAFRYVPVVTLLTTEYGGPGGLRAFADQTTAALGRDGSVVSPVDRRQGQLPGGPTELLHYTVRSGSATADVVRYLLYDEEREVAYQLRFETAVPQASALRAQVVAIASSFRTPASPSR